MVSLAAKKQLTLDEVTGKNESKLKKRSKEINDSSKAKKVSKVRTENWKRYIEDIIFLKHLYSMAYIDTFKYDSRDFQKNILDLVTNKDVFEESQQTYWVGFPKDDNGNESDDSVIETVNTPIYDRKSEGSVRFLDPKWVKEHCHKKFILQLKNNVN